jgi:hypothetical protein
MVGLDDTVGSVDTNGVHVVALAGLEDTFCVSGRGNEAASGFIIDVVAVDLRTSNGGIAGLEAEHVRAQEIVPFDNLLEGVVVTIVAGESVGVNERTEGVATLISAVGVHLTTLILCVDVDILLVHSSNNENVCRGPEELHTGQRALGNDTSTMSRRGAPGHSLGLSISDSAVRNRRAPKAEILDVVDHGKLAQRVGAFGGAVTHGVPRLGTTSRVIGVDLVGDLTGILVSPVRKRFDAGLCEDRGGQGGYNGQRTNVIEHLNDGSRMLEVK